MNILTATGESCRLIGVGENTEECCQSILVSAARCNAEAMAVAELLAACHVLSIIDPVDKPGELNGPLYWRINWR